MAKDGGGESVRPEGMEVGLIGFTVEFEGIVVGELWVLLGSAKCL